MILRLLFQELRLREFWPFSQFSEKKRFEHHQIFSIFTIFLQFLIFILLVFRKYEFVAPLTYMVESG